MENPQIYHEKQVRELCALHALNNLFQNKEAFTKAELDNICYELSPDHWINPHKSVLGLGNYDINVIMKALQSKGYEVIWFDKRKDPGNLNLKNVYGLILNIPSEYKLSFITLPLRLKHWIAIREINGVYYNLDSKLSEPLLLGQEDELMNFLKEELECKDKELFVVVSGEADKQQNWFSEDYNYVNNIAERDAEILNLEDINNCGNTTVKHN